MYIYIFCFITEEEVTVDCPQTTTVIHQVAYCLSNDKSTMSTMCNNFFFKSTRVECLWLGIICAYIYMCARVLEYLYWTFVCVCVICVCDVCVHEIDIE